MAPAAKKSKDAEKEPKGKKTAAKATKEKRVSKPSGYMHFSKVIRPKLKEDEPDLAPKEYMSRIGQLWSECSDKEKKKYEAQRDKEWEASGGPAKLEEYKAKQAAEKSSGKAAKKTAKKPAAKKAKKPKEAESEDEEDEGDSPAEEAAGDESAGEEEPAAADEDSE